MKNSKYVLSRLTGVTSSIYIVGAIASGLITYYVTIGVMFKQSENMLESVLSSRSIAVEEYFRQNIEQAAHLAKNEMIVRSLKDFTEGFSLLSADTDANMQPGGAEHGELVEFYQSEHEPLLLTEPSEDRSRSGYLPSSEAGRIAQWVYFVQRPSQIGLKDEASRGDRDSRYEVAHRDYHPKIDNFMKSFGYKDLFLLNPAGDIVYSHLKEVDFGTNVLDGRYSDSGIGRASRGALSTGGASVTIADFENYEPSYFEPASFLAAPIWDGDKLVGAVAFQLDPGKLNSVVSDLHGLGHSTESYIIGADFLMRSDSRFTSDSSILRQKVESLSAKDVVLGRSGSTLCEDYRGIRVLSQYQPLNIPGLKWSILAEIDEADLEAPAQRLAAYTVGILIATLLTVAMVSLMTLRLCVIRPLKQLLRIASEFKAGNFSARVYLIAEDEFAALAKSHNQMADSVEGHILKLEKSLAEIKELRGLLPICSACKSIRDDDGYFKTVETYLVGRSNVEFTHTICQSCIPLLYPEVELSNNPPAQGYPGE